MLLTHDAHSSSECGLLPLISYNVWRFSYTLEESFSLKHGIIISILRVIVKIREDYLSKFILIYNKLLFLLHLSQIMCRKQYKQVNNITDKQYKTYVENNRMTTSNQNPMLLTKSHYYCGHSIVN